MFVRHIDGLEGPLNRLFKNIGVSFDDNSNNHTLYAIQPWVYKF